MLPGEMKPTVVVDMQASRRSSSVRWVLTAAAVVLLLGAGLWLGFGAGRDGASATGSAPGASAHHTGSFSQGRDVDHTPASSPATGSTASTNQAATAKAAHAAEIAREQAAMEQQRQAAEQQAQWQAQQQQAAREQAEQLAAQQRQLQQQAADQAAQARRLADDKARVQAEQASLDQARLDAAAAARASQGNRARPAYHGPSSGTLVWQGEVNGTTLVTITDGQPDQGHIVSGGLPGVLVLLQPGDSKHVVIASAPSPSNGYQKLTLRVQGKGVVEETIHWSVE